MRTATHSITHIEHKHVLWFVAGAIHEHGDRTEVLSAWSHARRLEFIDATVNLVLEYMRGACDLDARFSDTQVYIATEAHKLFKPVPRKTDGGICEHCGEPNMAHMGGPCAESQGWVRSKTDAEAQKRLDAAQDLGGF